MIKNITVPVNEEIIRYAETLQKRGTNSVEVILAELLKAGFEAHIRAHYEEYRQGRITLRQLASRLGLPYRDLYDLLEQKGLTF